MTKIVGTSNDGSKIKFIESVYGKEHFEKNSSVQFGNEKIVGWYVVGYDTLAELKQKYNQEQILELFEEQK